MIGLNQAVKTHSDAKSYTETEKAKLHEVCKRMFTWYTLERT